jgi:hypothetical protein
LLVPALVPEEESRAAMAMDSVSYNVARAAAPLVAVLMVSTVGFGWVFVVNGVSFLVLAARLRIVKPYPVMRPTGTTKIMEGLHLAGQERSIRLLLLTVAAVTIAADPVLVLGPAMANHLGVSSDWAGYFLAALGTGTVVGSLIPVRRPSRLLHAAYPLLLLGGAGIVFAGGLSPWACLAMAFVAGFACLLTGSVTRTLLLSLAEPRRAYAVFAVWAAAWAGSKPAASLVDGLIASHWGVTFAGSLMALPALLSGLVIILHNSWDGGGIERTTPRQYMTGRFLKFKTLFKKGRDPVIWTNETYREHLSRKYPQPPPVAGIPVGLVEVALGAGSVIFAKAFIEALGRNAGESAAKLPKRVRQLVRTHKRRNGKLEEHISAASPITAIIIVTADLPDEARLALLDLDVTAEELRGKLLRWNPTALKFPGFCDLMSGFLRLVTVWLHVGRGGVTGSDGP